MRFGPTAERSDARAGRRHAQRAPLKSAGVRDQLGLASHLVHARVPRSDDVAFERRVRACESNEVAGCGEQICQKNPSGFTIEIVVTGETRRQGKKFINGERLRAERYAKRRRN